MKMKPQLVAFYAISFLLISACASKKMEYSNEAISITGQQLEKLPEKVCLFSGIKHLNLQKNNLSTLNACLSNFNQLEVLNLNRNQFNDIPKEVYQLKNLKELHLAGNPIQEIPRQIEVLTQLEVLDLWDTSISEVPKWIIDLKNLKVLDVRNTYLKTADLDWLIKARPDLKVESSFGCNCN